jgi:hypothetical protein
VHQARVFSAIASHFSFVVAVWIPSSKAGLSSCIFLFYQKAAPDKALYWHCQRDWGKVNRLTLFFILSSAGFEMAVVSLQ